MTSGAWTLMNAPRSSVPFWISASRAVTVAKPSFSRAERMASITSSRELKIATRGGDVRGTTAVVLSPLHARHAQRVRASRGPYAAREEQGEELTRAAALRESRPCTREAQPQCTSRRGRDAEAGAPSIVPLRRRTDSGTAAERWTSPWSLSRIKNIFYYSYIRCLKTLPSHADAIARSIAGVLVSPRVHSLDLRIRGLGDRSGRVRTFRRVPTTLSGVLGTRLVLRIGRRRSASHRLSRLLVASDHVGNGRNIGVGKLADDA